MATVAEHLREGRERLAEADVSEPQREAASLLALALDRDRTFLIAHPEYALSEGETARFASFIERRADREPFQYIAGNQEFYGLNFEVTPDVLIPRPETELIVEAAVELLSPLAEPFFCEVGVGSGCIAVSILHELPAARAIGLDVSPTALAVAERNADRHGVAERLRFLESDVFSALDSGLRFDLIASNPPYVPIDQFVGLQEEVRDFEPRSALTDGGDGLSIVSRIVTDAPDHLATGGHLLLEIGFDQSERVRAMFDPQIWGEVDVRPDLQGIPRMLRARLK